MDLAKALVVLALAAIVADTPFVLERVVELGGAIVTPLVMLFVFMTFGVFIAYLAPTGRWTGVALATIAVAVLYGVGTVIGATGDGVGTAPAGGRESLLRITTLALPFAVKALVFGGAFLSLGAWSYVAEPRPPILASLWRAARRAMTTTQALVITVLSLILAYVPFQLGEFFGFGAILVTPVVLVVLLMILGAIVARMAPTGRWMRIAFASVVIAASYALASVGREKATSLLPPSKQLFVIVPAAQGPVFTTALAKLLKERGMDATLSEFAYDDGPITYGLSITGSVSILVYNATMSSRRCVGDGASPQADPGQYLLSVQSSAPCSGTAESTAIYDSLRRDLVSRGYDVRDRQAECAAVASAPEPRP